MKNIPYDNCFGLKLPKEVQIRRLLRVMEAELTARQQAYLAAYYFDELRPSQIARQYGVNRSTVIRTLRRAEDRLRRHLIY